MVKVELARFFMGHGVYIRRQVHCISVIVVQYWQPWQRRNAVVRARKWKSEGNWCRYDNRNVRSSESVFTVNYTENQPPSRHRNRARTQCRRQHNPTRSHTRYRLCLCDMRPTFSDVNYFWIRDFCPRHASNALSQFLHRQWRGRLHRCVTYFHCSLSSSLIYSHSRRLSRGKSVRMQPEKMFSGGDFTFQQDGAPFVKNCRLTAYSCTRLHWTWKLASQKPGLDFGGLLYIGCFTAACLPTAGSRRWAPEGRSGNKLRTNQPGLCWSSSPTVSETISLNHCRERQPCWTFFWLAVWLLSACYLSFA